VQDAVGFRHRQAAEDDAGDDAEHGGRQADTEPQREHRRHGVAGIAEEQAAAETDVLGQ
jgi:hypothetical protein